MNKRQRKKLNKKIEAKKQRRKDSICEGILKMLRSEMSPWQSKFWDILNANSSRSKARFVPFKSDSAEPKHKTRIRDGLPLPYQLDESFARSRPHNHVSMIQKTMIVFDEMDTIGEDVYNSIAKRLQGVPNE